MAEYFVGANVYERLQWNLKNIEKEQKKIARAKNRIYEIRKQSLRILEEHDSEELAIWFAEQNN